MFGFETTGEATQAEDIAAALETVFDREADALRNGDFGALEDILAEKERLSESLAGLSPPLGPDMARRLQARAMRNAGLLDSARQGLRSAAERITALSAPRTPLQTYDDRGRRATLSTSTSGPVRRA